jgi:hypothetical protein
MLCHYAEYHFIYYSAQCHYAECHYASVILLSVIMLSVTILNVVAPFVIAGRFHPILIFEGKAKANPGVTFWGLHSKCGLLGPMLQNFLPP